MAGKKLCLWYVLAIVGINIPGYRFRLASKCFFMILRILFLLVLTYVILVYVYYTVYVRTTEGVYFLFLMWPSFIIYYLVFRRREKLSILEQHLERYQKYYLAAGSLKTSFVNILTICILVFAALLSIPNLVQPNETFLDNWLFGYKIKDRHLRVVCEFYALLVSYTIFSVPLFFTLFLNVTFYRWGLVLKIIGN